MMDRRFAGNRARSRIGQVQVGVSRRCLVGEQHPKGDALSCCSASKWVGVVDRQRNLARDQRRRSRSLPEKTAFELPAATLKHPSRRGPFGEEAQPIDRMPSLFE